MAKPTLLDARIQLEGGLERLEAWAEDFAAIEADLKSSQWRGWLDAHRHVWERLIRNERELLPVLEKARAIAPGNPPLIRWLAQWEKRRTAVFRRAQKRRGVQATTFAHLRVLLRQVPLPPSVEFASRRTFWEWSNSRSIWDRTDAVVVTSETLTVVGQPADPLATVAEVVIGRVTGTANGVLVVRLANGDTRRGTIRARDEERLAQALERVRVRVVR